MSIIRVLPPFEVQKIAAGEVVERPANVVKELIENALDAGATEITLFIEDGGKQLIRIIDNGCGMEPEDARLCIEHHATSKLTSLNDLSHMRTFGFRGEALSSIAAVSSMDIITKQEKATAGTHLEIYEGTITLERLTPANSGTDIAIKHLFFNVPARQKFLKAKETEWRAIMHLVQALALAHPQVSYKLYHENKLALHAPATTSMSLRLGQLFEPALTHNSLEFEQAQTRMELSVTGALSTPAYTRFDRSQIYVFVNRRWVKNHRLVQAFIKGYQQMLQPGKYPAGCLFISLDPSYVDINVHPRKEEVQFLHPRIVEELIEETVRTCLENKHSTAALKKMLTPRESLETDLRSIPQASQTISIPEKTGHRENATAPRTPQPAIVSLQEKALKETFPNKNDQEKLSISTNEFKAAIDQVFTPATKELYDTDLQTSFTADAELQTHYRILGQLDLTYVLLEKNGRLAIIDQHAAHERMTYERLRSRFEEVTTGEAALSTSYYDVGMTIAHSSSHILSSCMHLESKHNAWRRHKSLSRIPRIF